MERCVIAVHGGAYLVPDRLLDQTRTGVRAAARAGEAVLRRGGCALDAVEAAVVCMEDLPFFNCGTGSVLTAQETVEMDALVMDGRSQAVGAVAGVPDVRHPIRLARAVMEQTDHCLMIGAGASALAERAGLERASTAELITENSRRRFEEYRQFMSTVTKTFGVREHDTVGAVAVDAAGNVAAATSTGGITGKEPGRVGDSPLVGSGGWAENGVAAVSTTGHGEAIMRVCLARRVASGVEAGRGVQAASEEALRHMRERVKGAGGLVAVDAAGEVGVAFSTERMAWAYAKAGVLHSGVVPGEDKTETVE